MIFHEGGGIAWQVGALPIIGSRTLVVGRNESGKGRQNDKPP